jgi:DNA-directed RNA polymerase beta subunit
LPKGIGSLPAVFKLFIKIDKGKPRIMCKIKNVNKDIPFVILMRALGIQTDLKVFNCVC